MSVCKLIIQTRAATGASAARPTFAGFILGEKYPDLARVNTDQFALLEVRDLAAGGDMTHAIRLASFHSHICG